MVKEAILETGFPVRGSSLRAARDKNLASRPVWRMAPALVSDQGDEHEMAEEFGHSLARAGDRIVGFAVGAGLIGAAWVLWMLI